MARSNEILLNGMVMQEPQIIYDAAGNYKRGSVPIQVIRGKREIGNNQLVNVRYDAPIIMTGDPARIAEMAELKQFDMVEIKGVYTTKNINRAKMCECGCKIVKPGTLSFISPILIEVREKGLTEAQCRQLLDRRNEISNTVSVIGNLTDDPEYTNDEKVKMCQYTIGVARKYFLKDDTTLSRADFPHIKAYGRNAEDDYLNVKKGTQVLITGMLQTRQYDQKFVCDECGAISVSPTVAMEIVPYSTEYLKNKCTQEETDEKKAQLATDIEEKLFA